MKKRKPFQKMSKLASSILLLVSTTAFAGDLAASSQYYQIDKAFFFDSSGNAIDKITINGPPTPPPGSVRSTVSMAAVQQQAGSNILQVPAFSWSFGCSATTAAMIAGYYDRNGYGNIYTGPTNGGVMPMDNSSWPDWTDGSGASRSQCPLSATHQGLDGRTSKGHVDDYWVKYGSTAADPFYGNWTEHAYGDCTGDYMKTNQTSKYGNSDGGTTFYLYPNGAPYSGSGSNNDDGAYGFKLFFESRGYTVTTYYTQLIYGYNGNTQGFTFTQYKEEIDAGRPVMIQVNGHTMAGIGYNDSDNTIYLNDTWDYSTHTMTWGGSYSGMQQWGVTVIRLAAPPAPAKSNLLFMVPLQH